MKSNISDYKIKLAKEAEELLPVLLVNYNTGDLISLGKLCNAINVLAEYYNENKKSDAAKRVPRLTKYLKDKYKNDIVLVLKNDSKCYSYTACNITKFIRGETLHGASENKDIKRKTLHDYVFEKDNNIECEYQVSWGCIVGPNLRSSNGNTDSGGPISHSVNLNGNKRVVSLIESVILAIAYEFWQANINEVPAESTKVFVQFNPLWFTSLWSKDFALKLKHSLVKYHNITVPENE